MNGHRRSSAASHHRLITAMRRTIFASNVQFDHTDSIQAEGRRRFRRRTPRHRRSAKKGIDFATSIDE